MEFSFGLGFLASVFSMSLWVLYRSMFRVEEGHLGILVQFGKVLIEKQGTQKLRTFPPGLHMKLPWQKALIVSIMEQNIDLSGKEEGVTATADDGTILRLDSRLRFSPVVDELYHFVFMLKNPLEHIKGLFTCLLRNEIANFRQHAESSLSEIGSYALIRKQRRRLNQCISDFCHRQISGRYGVEFNAVDLTDILPPDELADGLNAVINAQTEANTNFAKTESECQQRLLAAKKGVEIAKAKAQAAETEILVLSDFLIDLEKSNTLEAYLSRRRTEVFSESRAVFRRCVQ